MKSAFLSTFLIFSALLFGTNIFSQSAIITQDYASRTFSMPALVGWHGGRGIYQQYRNHRPGIPVSFVTYNAGIDEYIHKLRSGFGLNFRYDMAYGGIVSVSQVNLHWSPKIRLGEKTWISPVATLSFLQQSLRWSRITDKDLIKNRYVNPFNTHSGLPSVNYIRKLILGSGIAFIRKGFMASAYCGYINQPNMSYYMDREVRQTKLWHIDLAQRFTPGAHFSLTPTLGYQRQGDFTLL